MEWNNTPPKAFARVNTLKADPGKLLAQWREENVEYDFVRKDWIEENLVFELKSHPPLGRLPSFQQGCSMCRTRARCWPCANSIRSPAKACSTSAPRPAGS
jgi:16S rRNA C967 or C1407 C5-methylase (RsmB/RsmF family)